MEKKVIIKYKKIFPVITLSCSMLISGTIFTTGLSPLIITGVMLFIAAILMFIVPAAIITEGKFVAKSIFGMTLSEHSFTKKSIKVDEGNIFINNKKVVTNWWSEFNKKELDELIRSMKR